MSDIIDTEDSPNLPMDARLNLQALKNKRYLDKTFEFDFYKSLNKRELLELLLKSTILMREGANEIERDRTTITRLQMDKINSL